MPAHKLCPRCDRNTFGYQKRRATWKCFSCLYESEDGFAHPDTSITLIGVHKLLLPETVRSQPLTGEQRASIFHFITEMLENNGMYEEAKRQWQVFKGLGKLKIYLKLVRDDIVSFLLSIGKKVVWHEIKNEEELRLEALRKLLEEVKELLEARSLEEAGDVYEIFLKVLELHGWTLEDVKAAAEQKASKKGKFEKNIYLVSVED